MGAYFVLNQQGLLPPQTVTNFEECALAGYPVGESHPRQCWTPDGRHFVEEIERPIMPPELITISGEITCLPKIGPGPQTMECAIGLKGADRRHYGLKNLFERGGHIFSQTGLQVEVSGMFSLEEMKGPDGNRYDIVGVIDVISIRKTKIELTNEIVLSLLKNNLLGDECRQEGIGGYYNSCVINISKENNQWMVVITYDGLFDDSVRASRIQTNVVYQDGQWLKGEIFRTQKCWPGRGHQEFSTELCI